MKAAVYESFGAPLEIRTLPDPTPPEDGVVLRVLATGLCLSDWHGWRGHDPDIALPHVPGHELCGLIEATGSAVQNFSAGERVTLPFVCGCGQCGECSSGNPQVCDAQFQPGFTHWGSFARFVAIAHADTNLVRVPESVEDVAAALLGCRFVTAFRALRHRARLEAGEWLAVHGCGGVGLSAVMIARACGARVVAIDLDDGRLRLARQLGAEISLNATDVGDVGSAVRDSSGGGCHVSVDAFGSPESCMNSIASLRKRGRHVQVGLLPGDANQPRLPMDRVIADELELLGSHGMQASRYGEIFEWIDAGRLDPAALIHERVDLARGAELLPRMDRFEGAGVTVIDGLD